jgi:hypothetical protein
MRLNPYKGPKRRARKDAMAARASHPSPCIESGTPQRRMGRRNNSYSQGRRGDTGYPVSWVNSKHEAEESNQVKLPQ